MKLLVTGAGGQVGRALLAMTVPEIILEGVTHAELDIRDAQAIAECLNTRQPDLVINAAAYTAVDKAETDAANAFAINGEAVGTIAKACKSRGCRLLQLSTDFVFDGSADRPYQSHDATAPLSIYGQSKLAGEHAAREALGGDAIVLRTAWVYASNGKNFVNTMLRLMRERDELGVVNDQFGSPTWATSIAETCVALARDPGAAGIYHWTDSGVASWYEFALEIQRQALECGLLDRKISINAITTADYPTPAKRPAYSVLDCSATEALSGVEAPEWQRNLGKMLKEKMDG